MSQLKESGAFIAKGDGEHETIHGNEPCCFVNIKVMNRGSSVILFTQNLIIDQKKVDMLIKAINIESHAYIRYASHNIRNSAITHEINPFVAFFNSISFPGIHMENFSPKFIKGFIYNGLIPDKDYQSKLSIIVENAV
jgi:hypothetical protein